MLSILLLDVRKGEEVPYGVVAWLEKVLYVDWIFSLYFVTFHESK